MRPSTTVVIFGEGWYTDSNGVDAHLHPGGITMPTHDPMARLRDQDVLAVQGGGSYLNDVERQTVQHICAWSRWRRWHQTVAGYYHYKRRQALAEALAA